MSLLSLEELYFLAHFFRIKVKKKQNKKTTVKHSTRSSLFDKYTNVSMGVDITGENPSITIYFIFYSQVAGSTTLRRAHAPPAAAETATRGAQATGGRRSSRRLAAWICGASPAPGRKIANLIGNTELRAAPKPRLNLARGAGMELINAWRRNRSTQSYIMICWNCNWHKQALWDLTDRAFV